MTDAENLIWGDKAESVLSHPDYQDLFDKLTDDLAKAILATNVTEEALRNELYHTYNGMRAFALRLETMMKVRDDIIARQEAENNDSVAYQETI